MKNYHISFSQIALATLVLGAGALLGADAPSHVTQSGAGRAPIWEEQAIPLPARPMQTPPAHGHVQRAGTNAENYGMIRMAGRPVRSVNGEELSTITDFLVDPQSGRVYFAILPSGAGPKGMTYRIVPISAFTGATADALLLRLDRAQWDRVGTMEEWQLKEHVTIEVDQQQRLSRQLGLPPAEIYDGQGAAELVRATALRGQAIRSGDANLGRIEDVVVDVNRHECAAVLTTDQAFSGSAQRYVVPLQYLGRNESGAWVSQLSRDDFRDFDPNRGLRQNDEVSRGYRDDRDREAPDYRDPRDVRDPHDPRVRVGPEAMALDVHQALERAGVRGGVDVTVEGNRLVLRGMVNDEHESADIARLAARTAPGIRIENQLAVRRR